MSHGPTAPFTMPIAVEWYVNGKKITIEHKVALDRIYALEKMLNNALLAWAAGAVAAQGSDK